MRPAEPTRGALIAYARQQAQIAGIDPDLFCRQINQESGWNPKAESLAGAQGIAQVVPRWHPEVIDPYDPFESLDWAAKTMAGYIANYGGWALALAAYNAGAPTVDRLGDAVFEIDETRRYIRAILGVEP